MRLENKNVLVLAAHPDDETLGCGATIAKLADNDCDVRLITFTDGISAREDGDRRDTLESVSKILGINDFKAYSFPDNQMDSCSLLEIVKAIEHYINSKAFIPDIVLTHNPYCLNIDHKVIYEATITAFRGLQKFNPIKIMCYEVPSSSEWNPLTRFTPNCYIDVSHYIKKKLRALEVYSSELRSHPHPRNIDNILNRLRVNGTECGLFVAERYQIVREVII
ncbi:GlcNAc-PI de-N-acetylase [Candidatus Pacearchaeota archaeon]|nr:GlcNAc-PI de-N-acetylase [Candidatus Pacearchaeota archaeon]|tara:strand:- start:7980 stop:8645 length:666 start_codon:yes stop_codon:yes gene_type:complete